MILRREIRVPLMDVLREPGYPEAAICSYIHNRYCQNNFKLCSVAEDLYDREYRVVYEYEKDVPRGPRIKPMGPGLRRFFWVRPRCRR